jgi:hypothetical protein
MVAVFVVVIFAFFALLNVFTLVLPRQFLQKRQDVKNNERQQFAMSQGWQFRPYAPELLTAYSCPPFTARGDRRVAFGAVAGMVDGLQVTVFDYQRRTKRTSYSFVVYSDSNEVNTVWVVKLPAALPSLYMAGRGMRLLTGRFIEPRTPDPEFNKQFLIEGGDENFAAELFTPQVTAMMKHIRLGDWTIQGNELVHPMRNGLTRTTAQEIQQTAHALVALVRSFPEHLWQRQGASLPPAGQPQQPMQQPMSGPQPIPQNMPAQSHPFPQPVMPQQPMPQYGQPQMQPPPGYYPPQYPPQPQPGWQQGPPQGYPPQHGGYPPR